VPAASVCSSWSSSSSWTWVLVTVAVVVTAAALLLLEVMTSASVGRAPSQCLRQWCQYKVSRHDAHVGLNAGTHQWSPCGSQPNDSVGDGPGVSWARAAETSPRRTAAYAATFILNMQSVGRSTVVRAGREREGHE
jgi:hypothetical protein